MTYLSLNAGLYIPGLAMALVCVGRPHWLLLRHILYPLLLQPLGIRIHNLNELLSAAGQTHRSDRIPHSKDDEKPPSAAEADDAYVAVDTQVASRPSHSRGVLAGVGGRVTGARVISRETGRDLKGREGYPDK